MRRRVRVDGAALLGALLGTWVLFCANAFAEETPRISWLFYPVSATELAAHSNLPPPRDYSPSPPTLGTLGGAVSVIMSWPSADRRVNVVSATPSVCTAEVSWIPPEDPPVAEVVSGYWVVNLLSAGTCTLVATEPEPASYGALETQQSFIVSAAPTETTSAVSTGAAEPRAMTAPAKSHQTAATPKRELTRAMKLKKALRACQKNKSKRERSRCQLRARRKYGTAKPETSIPANVRAELLKVTLDDTSTKGELFSSDMQAVRTTLAKAGHATEFSARGLPGQTPVYVVAFRFSEECITTPGGGCGPDKHVLELEFLASSPLRILPLREEQQYSYPDLRKMGAPVLLAAVPPRR